MQLYSVYLGKIDTDKVVWNLKIEDLETIAGILAGTLSILKNLERIECYIDTDADVSKFRLFDNIPEYNITKYSFTEIFSDMKYAIWMPSYNKDQYSLYTFNTSKFFQGILTICESFKVDFRDYIYGMPFDKNGIRYTLYGHTMVPYDVAEDAPDLSDVEEEEADDENILEPLKKDY